jgi:hypothetical protein
MPDSLQPFHIPALVYTCLMLGEMLDFESPAEARAEQGGYAVFLLVPPLTFTGSAGATPRPVAIL